MSDENNAARVLASSPMHGSLRTLTLAAHHRLSVANLGTSRDVTLLLTHTMTVVDTVMITRPMFAVILLLIGILTVADTGANVFQMRGLVVIMIPEKMGGMMTGTWQPWCHGAPS